MVVVVVGAESNKEPPAADEWNAWRVPLQKEIEADQILFKECPSEQLIRERQDAVANARRMMDAADAAHRAAASESVDRAWLAAQRATAAAEACTKAAAEAKHKRVVELIDPKKTVKIVLSALVCREKAFERLNLEAIKEERSNSRIGGVVNLLELKQLQDGVVRARRLMAAHREQAAKVAVTLAPCTDYIDSLIYCYENRDDEEQCGAELVKILADMMWKLDTRNTPTWQLDTRNDPTVR